MFGSFIAIPSDIRKASQIDVRPCLHPRIGRGIEHFLEEPFPISGSSAVQHSISMPARGHGVVAAFAPECEDSLLGVLRNPCCHTVRSAHPSALSVGLGQRSLRRSTATTSPRERASLGELDAASRLSSRPGSIPLIISGRKAHASRCFFVNSELARRNTARNIEPAPQRIIHGVGMSGQPSLDSLMSDSVVSSRKS